MWWKIEDSSVVDEGWLSNWAFIPWKEQVTGSPEMVNKIHKAQESTGENNRDRTAGIDDLKKGQGRQGQWKHKVMKKEETGGKHSWN